MSAILFRHRRQHNLFPGIDVIYKHVIVMHLRSTPRGLEWIIDGYSDLTMQQSQFIIVHQSNVKCVSNDDFYIKHCLSLTYIYCLNLPWPCDAMWQQQCWLSEELTLIKYQSKHNNSRKCIRKFHLQKAFCSSLSIGTIVTVPRKQAVWCRYNAVNFLTNFHKRHPIARPLGRGMWCLLRIQHLIDFLPQFLHRFRQYLTRFDRVITALDSISILLVAQTMTTVTINSSCKVTDNLSVFQTASTESQSTRVPKLKIRTNVGYQFW